MNNIDFDNKLRNFNGQITSYKQTFSSSKENKLSKNKR